jgi:lipoprotein
MEIKKLIMFALSTLVFTACAEKEYTCQDYEKDGAVCGYRP